MKPREPVVRYEGFTEEMLEEMAMSYEELMRKVLRDATIGRLTWNAAAYRACREQSYLDQIRETMHLWKRLKKRIF